MEQNLQLSGGNKRKLFSVLVFLPMLDIPKQDERKLSLSLFHQFFFCGKANYGWCHQPQIYCVSLKAKESNKYLYNKLQILHILCFSGFHHDLASHPSLEVISAHLNCVILGSYRRNKNLIRRCLTKSFCWYQGTLLFEGNIVSELHFSNPREDTMLLS